MFADTRMLYATSFNLVFALLETITYVYGQSCDVRGTLFQCKVSLPQKNDQYSSIRHCAIARYQETMMQQTYYKLNVPKDPRDDNPTNEPLFPRLDQSQVNIALKASFGDENAKWFSNYYGNIQLLNMTRDQLNPLFGKKPLNSYAEYRMIFQSFLKVAKRIPSPMFGTPSETPNFTNIVTDEKWKNDKYFVQRRLAGQCSYFLKLVSEKAEKTIGMSADKLLSLLNDNFQWNRYLKENYKMTLDEAISRKRLFVLYHEEYGKLPQTPDILDIDPEDNIKLRNSSNPISLFVLNEKHELKIAAIQINDSKIAHVFTPQDEEYAWLQAKGSVEIVEMAVCQLIGHLLETHSTQEVFCNLFRRHLGSLHPLHQIMVPHCEGTSPVGALGLGALFDHERFMHRLFNIGHVGSRILVNEHYKFQSYEDADFELQLERNGLNDSSRIHYHPYRDDGKVIWNEIKSFATQYVELYYRNDKYVEYDRELQSFVNEVSANGTAEKGGKYKGFPARFTKRSDVSTFLTRFIWLVVKHAANSYPLVPYGAYIPIAPTKLYDNPEGDQKMKYVYNLPNGKVVLTQEVLVFTLATFRVNRLFDYSKKLEDSKARCLVRQTYQRLNTCIQKELEEKNAQRFNNDDLTYQYLEPKWLPNSIHS